MTVLIFENARGEQKRVDAKPGSSIMEIAVESGISGILADCGGGCSCATCHCYVESGDFPEPDEIESEMLECVLAPKNNSRLSCQLVVRDDMPKIIIKLPASQI